MFPKAVSKNAQARAAPGGVMGLCPRKRREGDKALSPGGELKMSLRFLIC